MSHKSNKSTDLSEMPPENERIELQRRVVAQLAGPFPMPSYEIGSEIGELREKLRVTSEKNTELRGKLKDVKKQMNEKIGALESQNKRQKETIRTLEAAQEKLQRDLETVKRAKDKLRIEVEEKISKFSKENEILTENLEALTKELQNVENENIDLKRNLEDLTNDNKFLKDDNKFLKHEVSSIQKENVQLKHDMGELRKDYDDIRERLERKETRLALGQVAWLLEAEIWKYVLPDQQMGTTRILNSMERWLKRNSKSVEGNAAQERWDILKSKLNWDEEDHKQALKILKDLRVDDAHPKDVDLGEARKQLTEGNYIAECDKKICQEIIDMIPKAKSINPGEE